MQQVNVYSDYICPFCFIGKYRVRRLVEEISIQPIWKPFEIHPEVPAGGVPIERFPAVVLERLEKSIGKLADELGIEMRMPKKLPNSHLALLGGEIAKEAGRFEQYHEAIFRGYFQSGSDIGEMGQLVELAQEAGIGAGDFRKLLQEKKFEDSLDSARGEARALALSAVPSFVFADRIIIGVQPYEIMKEAAEKSSKTGSQPHVT